MCCNTTYVSCCSDFLFVLWRSFRRIMYPRYIIYKYHISALHSLTLLCILSLLFTTCPITVMTRESVYKFVINLRYLYRITKSKPVENCDVNHFLSVCVEVKRITCVKHFSCNCLFIVQKSHSEEGKQRMSSSARLCNNNSQNHLL